MSEKREFESNNRVNIIPDLPSMSAKPVVPMPYYKIGNQKIFENTPEIVILFPKEMPKPSAVQEFRGRGPDMANFNKVTWIHRFYYDKLSKELAEALATIEKLERK